jgi:hypothetical protein
MKAVDEWCVEFIQMPTKTNVDGSLAKNTHNER